MQIKLKHLEGYAFGAIQPTVVFSFSNLTTQSDQIIAQLVKLKADLPLFYDPEPFKGDISLIKKNEGPALFITIVDTLKQHCGDQRFTLIRVFEDDGETCFAVPTLSLKLVSAISRVVQSLLENLAKGMTDEQLSKSLNELRQRMRPFLPSGTNAGNFITAAAERKIPFKIFSNSYVIFGYGRASKIFNSSITEQESAIGVLLAKSKVDTNRLLKMSGFPVAEQMRVNKREDAIRFANKVGYPVVLKPESEEQGRGVCTYLQTEEELSATFVHLASKYQNIIVEQHYFGDGYRVYVLNNKVVRVRRLQAANVVGDGFSSIRELIDKENCSDERNYISASMKKIIIDDDLVKMLKKQGLTLSDIPLLGHRVHLANTSNLSRGGKSTDFLNSLHPENRLLCEQVTKTLGLYCSGVDLISRDAAVPWYANGAIVCEVNAQPQIGSVGKVSMHDQMIDDAKITKLPIALTVLGDGKNSSESIFNKCLKQLQIDISADKILNSGCPVQYYDSLKISSDVPEKMRKKIEVMLVSVPPNSK